MAVEVAVIKGVAPTDGSTVSYESEGFGHPVAAIVMYDYEPHSNIRSHSVGFFDGVNQFTHGLSSTDNSSTTDTFRSSSTSHIVSIGNGVKGAATRWANNGIEIDWEAAPDPKSS